MQQGQEWLAEQQKMHMSREVTYDRGGIEVVVQAVVGRTLLKLSDGQGSIRMVWTDRDFLILASDLTAGGVALPPRRGDRIYESSDGRRYTYDVAAPDGEREWRWADVFRTRVRVHTKQIRVE